MPADPPLFLCLLLVFFQFQWPRRFYTDGAFSYVELECREVEATCLDRRVNQAKLLLWPDFHLF